jgi:hypothetical protein
MRFVGRTLIAADEVDLGKTIGGGLHLERTSGASVRAPALSQTTCQREGRLGVRLLTRTTRRVAPTEAGERLKKVIAPRNRERAGLIARIASEARGHGAYHGYRIRD